MTSTLTGPAIITRYLGPTGHRPARIVATHKRDSERTIRATVAWDHSLSAVANHRTAALACLARCAFSQPMALAARGHDHDCYLWVATGEWQMEPAALALTACRELIAALTGGGSADSLALPLALARMATGAADVHPVVDGFAVTTAGVTLQDPLGRPVDGLSFHGALSPSGALAAAKAAGWPLTAPMAHTAGHLQGDPDPAAVAQALSAKGGCPAVVATLATSRQAIPTHADPMSDAQTVDAIAALLSADTWSSDQLNTVADMVRATGRVIADPAESEGAA